MERLPVGRELYIKDNLNDITYKSELPPLFRFVSSREMQSISGI